MKHTKPTNGLGKALRTLRLGAGLTLEQVSAAAGVSISYLSRVENGDASPTALWFANVATEIGNVLDRQSAA